MTITKAVLFAVLLAPVVLCAQTYQEKVVAAVIIGEAGGEGNRGMVAVGEVIARRSKRTNQTPYSVVTTPRHFSCLNRKSPAKLYASSARHPKYAVALEIAKVVCRSPEKLPNTTNRADHFTRVGERTSWSRGRKPVAVIGDHAFYKLY